MVAGRQIGAVRVSVNAPVTHPANFCVGAKVTPHMTTTIRIIAGAIALLTLLPVAGAQVAQPTDRADQAVGR